MTSRSLSTYSVLFMSSLIMISGFWGSYSLVAPIPKLSPLFMQMIVNWDGPRLFINLMTGTDLGRHWIDIPGVPLLIVTSYAAMRAIRNTWALSEEIWSFLLGGVLIGLVLSLFWQVGGHIVGMTALIFGYTGILIIAMLRGMIRYIALFLKKGGGSALDMYRDVFLFFFLTLPMSVIYFVAIVGGGLYGYFLLLTYLSVAATLFLACRGSYTAVQHVILAKPSWRREKT